MDGPYSQRRVCSSLFLLFAACASLVSLLLFVGVETVHEYGLALDHNSPRFLSDKKSVADMISTDISMISIVPRSKAKSKRQVNETGNSTDWPADSNKNLNDHTKHRGIQSTTKGAPGLDLSTSIRLEAERDDKLFYMYDLDEEFWWRWPVDGTDCSGNGYVGHDHKQNSGIGPLVKPDSGLYLTWHFSLFSSLYNRMKRSSRRTLDPSKASLFIIPYDLGLDGYLSAETCRNRRSCSHGLVGKLTKLLQRSPWFARHQGADHALLWSLGQYHPWPRAGCDIFMSQFCGKCTITCYWMDATKAENRFISVPFPSGYHWWDGIKQVPWDLGLIPNRTMTAVYLGSTQTLNPTHTKIRRSMTQQCNASSECHWMRIGHSSKDTNIADFVSVYQRSKFCLCPPGDDPARKAVFDAIVSGCIPVIFELNTLYNQYPWHFSEQEALDISVYVPGLAVKAHHINFMDVLLAISPEVIRKKQEVLAVIAPRVQYAMPPPEYLKDKYDNTTWDPPFKDGVELTLDGMFARTYSVVHNQSTGIPHRLMSGREWGRIYNTVRVQVPNITTTSNRSSSGGGGGGIASMQPGPGGKDEQEVQDGRIKQFLRNKKVAIGGALGGSGGGGGAAGLQGPAALFARKKAGGKGLHPGVGGAHVAGRGGLGRGKALKGGAGVGGGGLGTNSDGGMVDPGGGPGRKHHNKVIGVGVGGSASTGGGGVGKRAGTGGAGGGRMSKGNRGMNKDGIAVERKHSIHDDALLMRGPGEEEHAKDLKQS